MLLGHHQHVPGREGEGFQLETIEGDTLGKINRSVCNAGQDKKKPCGAVWAKKVAWGWGEVAVPSHHRRLLQPGGAGEPMTPCRRVLRGLPGPCRMRCARVGG